MQPYQEEYIANLKDIAVLTAACKKQDMETLSFAEYHARALQNNVLAREKAARNMTLLRENLFPVLDHIFEADGDALENLQEFAGQLLNGNEETDVGLFCQIHKALLSLARQTKNREDLIRELYWLGMGYYHLCNRLVGLEGEESWQYTVQMRLCFTEAAAYLKYFDEIEDTQTRGYILRSRANMSLGQFPQPGDKIRMVKRTLQILQDTEYQEKEPNLPWDRFVYLTHQQMAASISYSREKGMTAQEVADVMESVYIVYQRRLQETAGRGERPPVRSRFSYDAIEHYCGLYGIETLLTKMEKLMDEADPADFSAEGMYGIISLPAFYCQFLNQYPEYLPERTSYLESLYRKIVDYVEAFPEASENQALFLYLRQLSFTYVETPDSLPYKEFLFSLLLRFAPETYVHSQVVADVSALFCGMILEEEPDFFDDIESIREITDKERKRAYVIEYAKECGMLHDVGKISFMELYSRTARQWFEDEYEMAHLHTLVGAAWLESRESTRRFAAVALGHHYWYDGSRGYPASYKRLECPYRQMVDVIGLFDWMNNVTDTAVSYTGVEKTFAEALAEAIALEGKRFSPLLTARLRDKEVTDKLKDAFIKGREDAYRKLYEWQLKGN
ncbi:MAG: hypothetical protein NC314_01980 [Roseburia sp.]|nr:hypothetical protein [Roseburia sp.]MCM1241585.1 hypothetical protein [Roseburia sp.]